MVVLVTLVVILEEALGEMRFTSDESISAGEFLSTMGTGLGGGLARGVIEKNVNEFLLCESCCALELFFWETRRMVLIHGEREQVRIAKSQCRIYISRLRMYLFWIISTRAVTGRATGKDQ
jgi:hypothetical protein